MSAMRRLLSAACCVALALSCGPGPSPGTAGVTTPASTPTPAPTVTASPTPRPSPLVSAKGTITVVDPASGETITGGVTVSGEATVFEATVSYRLVTAGGKVIAEGTTTATAGAPQKGTFKAEVRFEQPLYGEAGFIEVFERSAKDGTISDIVRVPVTIVGSY